MNKPQQHEPLNASGSKGGGDRVSHLPQNDWVIEFEENFVADNILDCIPLISWKEMKGGVVGLIENEISKAKKGEWNKAIEKVLETESGGGNWRRVCEQLKK